MVSKSSFHNFIGFDKLFYFNDPLSNHFYRGKVELDEYNEVDEWDIFWGKRLPQKPLTINHKMGRKVPGDIIWTSFPPIGPIVNEKVVKLLEDNEFTGWSTYPVKVLDKNGNRVSEYYGLSVTGRCGPIDFSMGRREWRFPNLPGCRPYEVYVGVFFDPSSWDGSDIFVSKNTARKFVVEKVEKVFNREKIKNIIFENVKDVCIDVTSV